MIDPVILSDSNADEAQLVFNHWLYNEPYSLLLILGKHDVARLALEKSNEMISSGAVEFASVRAIQAPVPDFIIPSLIVLKTSPDMKPINWDKIGLYAIMSISNKYNNICEIVTNDDFPLHPGGQINMLVRRAQAFDRPLDQ